MPTMDFEAYLPSDAPAAERTRVLAEILRNEDAAGIEMVVVMPMPIARPNNLALAETVRGEPRVLPCCQVNPSFGDEAVQEIEQAFTQWGMRMVKLMPTRYHFPLLGTQALAIMNKARELGLIANIHSGGGYAHPPAIGALPRRYPDVPIIMDHGGNLARLYGLNRP